MKKLLIAGRPGWISFLLTVALTALAWQPASGEEHVKTPQPRKLRVVVIGGAL